MKDLNQQRARCLSAISTTILAAILATTSFISPVLAGPCTGPDGRNEIAASLDHAGANRPVVVTFRSTAEGVRLPAYLVEEHPDKTTVILQYQFDNLAIKDDRFEVDLWFKRRYARVVVPFDAVTGVWDNNVKMC